MVTHSNPVSYRLIIGFFCSFWILGALFCPTTLASNYLQEDLKAYKSSKYTSPTWDSLIEEGMKTFHKGDYDMAMELLYKGFNKGCQSPLVLFQLGL